MSDTAATAVPAKKETRIPNEFSRNPLMQEFFKVYLDGLDEITAYNAEVLAEKDSEWNARKVLEEAKKYASPEDENDVKPEIKKVYDEYERLQDELIQAKKKVLEETSKVLGISLSAVADRDPEKEGLLKEKRKTSIEIGTQLANIAKLTTDEKATAAVDKFLADYPLPAIGRDQTRSFTSTDGGTTPKYRVIVTVTKDGEELLSEKGFTKTALALTKPVFGYERGKAPKSDDLRGVWEKAGNTSENTVQGTVTFEDNGLVYTIRKN